MNARWILKIVIPSVVIAIVIILSIFLYYELSKSKGEVKFSWQEFHTYDVVGETRARECNYKGFYVVNSKIRIPVYRSCDKVENYSPWPTLH